LEISLIHLVQHSPQHVARVLFTWLWSWYCVIGMGKHSFLWMKSGNRWLLIGI